MKIPHTINKNYLKEYEASGASLRMVQERRRYVFGEDFTWDADHIPYLSVMCTRVLVDDFKRQKVLEGLPCDNRNQVLETLPTSLPLPLVTQIIPDGVYWQRMVEDRWPQCVNHVEDYGRSWKRFFMERHLQEAVESMTPEGYDLEKVEALCKLVSSYVKKLVVRQLHILQPDVVAEFPDECTTIPVPKDHIDLCPIIQGLKNLTELHIQFGLRNVGTDYRKEWFQFSAEDCRNIGKGVAGAKNLRLLRIHNSTLDCNKTIALLSHMTDNSSLETLDFSNCIIGDDGATAMAKFLKGRHRLRCVNLSNNKIREAGVSALSFVVTREECSPLTDLNLRLNSFGDGGAKFLASALIRPNPKIQTLNLSCCNLSEESGILFGEMFSRNGVLVDFDLSNNNLGPRAGDALESGLSTNKTLQYFDLRMTGVTNTTQLYVNRILHLNRIRARKGERAVEKEILRLEELAAMELLREEAEEEEEEEPAPPPPPVEVKKPA